METIYYTKQFTKGLLKGLTFVTSVTFDKSLTAMWVKWIQEHKTKEVKAHGESFIIVDYSFQNYARQESKMAKYKVVTGILKIMNLTVILSPQRASLAFGMTIQRVGHILKIIVLNCQQVNFMILQVLGFMTLTTN